jgi:hypothetical protein
VREERAGVQRKTEVLFTETSPGGRAYLGGLDPMRMGREVGHVRFMYLGVLPSVNRNSPHASR